MIINPETADKRGRQLWGAGCTAHVLVTVLPIYMILYLRGGVHAHCEDSALLALKEALSPSLCKRPVVLQYLAVLIWKEHQCSSVVSQ